MHPCVAPNLCDFLYKTEKKEHSLKHKLHVKYLIIFLAVYFDITVKVF